MTCDGSEMAGVFELHSAKHHVLVSHSVVLGSEAMIAQW